MIEINVPDHTIDILFGLVTQRLGNRTLGNFPFYTKVDEQIAEPALGNWIDTTQISAGYIYGHDETIPLHTDKWKSTSYFNLNIPLYNTDTSQYFMVFDQEFPDRGCEWQVQGLSQRRHEPLTNNDKSSSNADNDHLESVCYTGVRPCETPVIGLTNEPVNIDIKKFLPFDTDFYHGLTGKVWRQDVGKGLIFKTTQLHGTAKQNKFKVGCVFLLKSQDCLITQ